MENDGLVSQLAEFLVLHLDQVLKMLRHILR